MIEKQFIETLLQVENNPAAIFEKVSESVIWDHAPKLILDNEHSELGLLLMFGIEKSFAQIDDKSALIRVLKVALAPTVDSLIFETVQRIILANAKEWKKDVLRQFYRAFEDAYLLTKSTKSMFIARMAIEARVMLPIFCQDELQIHSAIGFLLDEFPILPTNNKDPADLAIKAIKLLRVSHEFLPKDPGIINQLLDCIDSKNVFVKSEASFNYGVVKLHSAFNVENKSDFLEALDQAAHYFKESSNLQENRTDSELLLQVCKCFLLLNELSTSNPLEVIRAVDEARALLFDRLILLGGLKSSDTSSLEFNLVQLIVYLEELTKQLESPEKLPDLTPRMKLLADFYQAIREYDTKEYFAQIAGKAAQRFIIWPKFISKFIEIQEIVAKLEIKLFDQNWRERATPHEIQFYEIALTELRQNSPNEIAVTRFREFRAAAKLMNPKFEDVIKDLQESGQPINEATFQILREHFDVEEKLYPIAQSNPSQEICKRILPTLRGLLDWHTIDERWPELSMTVQVTSNFFHEICKVDKREDTKFLFAAKIGGLGNKAKESDLEEYFMQKLGGAWPVERQPKNETPGRADLFFRCNHGINFPIEVKVEKEDISPENIRKSYLSQPHLYATTTSQVCFLFVLDVILKDKEPGKFEADYWYIDSLESEETDYPIYTIVVIIPANRFRPSDYSWGKT